MAGKFEWHKFSEVNLEDPFLIHSKRIMRNFRFGLRKKAMQGSMP